MAITARVSSVTFVSGSELLLRIGELVPDVPILFMVFMIVFNDFFSVVI